LCCVFCLSSSCALCMVVSNTYCVVYFVCLRLVPCVWWCPTHIVLCIYTRHKTKTNKIKYTTQYVLDTIIHKAQDEDKQNTQRLSSSCALCMVVSNTYCVVYFTLFVFVLCLVYGGVQHILCCEYTTQYVLDTTIHKAQDEDKQNKIHNTICVGHHHTQGTRRRQTK
jgi:hypothetical protein